MISSNNDLRYCEVTGVVNEAHEDNRNKSNWISRSEHITRLTESHKTENNEEGETPPELPPRPPPRPRPAECVCDCDINDQDFTYSIQSNHLSFVEPSRSCWSNGLRKYVFLCSACGSLSIMLGALFLIVYFMLKSYTSSLNYFETIPTYIPSGMLIVTGLLIICLACRKNRNSFLMKLCGGCSLCCAVLCVAVTVTTTVIHMNRLQTLRECLYTQKTHSCTCYSVIHDTNDRNDEGVKFVFNSTPDCEVIHGTLYSCLRAVFGLSVIGILICIFSCMLIYQLLSHEKKKMYWAQLEMRCRYLYRQQRNQHYCSCCDDCRYPPPPPHELFPWELMGNRFWSHGRMGNLYTPNPENQGTQGRLRSAWNWRRLPWNRNHSATSSDPARNNLGSPDSQYGFSSQPHVPIEGAPYTVVDPHSTALPPVLRHFPMPPRLGEDVTEGGFYSWGPPPPYASNHNSVNNSPARRTIGQLLNQASPIRRNDNVSPVGPGHPFRQHRSHHSHPHNYVCSSTARPGNTHISAVGINQVQKLSQNVVTHLEQTPLSNQHPVSVHSAQKINSQNTYEGQNLRFEGLNNSNFSGFNTLPNLKKRNQPHVSDIFQNSNLRSSGFSSAENVAASHATLNIVPRQEELPPRVYLYKNIRDESYAQSNISDQSSIQSVSSKPRNKIDYDPNLNRISVITSGTASVGRSSRKKNLVNQFVISCSPTSREDDRFSNSSSNYFQRKPITDSDYYSAELGEASVRGYGLPRSPNIQNFNLLNATNSVETTPHHSSESTKASIGLAMLTKDENLIQKHKSLIREFNKARESQVFFNQVNEKCNLQSNVPGDDQTLKSTNRLKFKETAMVENMSGSDVNDRTKGNITFPKSSESGSETYFGDGSSSSFHNNSLTSSIYEEPVDNRKKINQQLKTKSPRRTLINKQHDLKSELDVHNTLKRGNNKSPKRLSPSLDKSSPGEHLEDLHKNRDLGELSYINLENMQLFHPKTPTKKDISLKSQRNLNTSPNVVVDKPIEQSYISNQVHLEPTDKIILPDIILEGTQDIPDAKSSDSLKKEGRKRSKKLQDGRTFETLNERFSDKELYNVHKRKEPDNVYQLSHPLFQKPKLLPKKDRFREEITQSKPISNEVLDQQENKKKEEKPIEEQVISSEGEKSLKRRRKKLAEEKVNISNQLLNTCILTLNQTEENLNSEKDIQKMYIKSKNIPPKNNANCSPQPLPRNAIPGPCAKNKKLDTAGIHVQRKHGHGKEKKSGYPLMLAPDIQYDCQEQDKTSNENKIKSQSRPINFIPSTPQKHPLGDDSRDSSSKRKTIELGGPSPRRTIAHTVDNNEDVWVKQTAGPPHSVNVVFQTTIASYFVQTGTQETISTTKAYPNKWYELPGTKLNFGILNEMILIS